MPISSLLQLPSAGSLGRESLRFAASDDGQLLHNLVDLSYRQCDHTRLTGFSYVSADEFASRVCPARSESTSVRVFIRGYHPKVEIAALLDATDALAQALEAVRELAPADALEAYLTLSEFIQSPDLFFDMHSIGSGLSSAPMDLDVFHQLEVSAEVVLREKAASWSSLDASSLIEHLEHLVAGELEGLTGFVMFDLGVGRLPSLDSSDSMFYALAKLYQRRTYGPFGLAVLPAPLASVLADFFGCDVFYAPPPSEDVLENMFCLFSPDGDGPYSTLSGAFKAAASL